MAEHSPEKDHSVFCRCQRLQAEVDERLALLALAVPLETPGSADG